MKFGVKIVLKTIKNYKISLKIVFLDILDVLMWLICEILQQVFELFFLSPKLQPNRYDYRNSCHKELGFGLNQSPRGCLSSLTTATDSAITVGITVGNIIGFILMEFIGKLKNKNNELKHISFQYFISLVHWFSHSFIQ